MFVELVYDKRNVDGLVGAREIILAELTKRVHQIFPDAEVKVKPMQANALNSDASKSDREKLNYADMHHYPSYFSDIERHFILVALNNKHFYYSLFLRSLQ